MEIELKQKKCSKNVPSKFKIETRLNKMVFIFSLLNKATDVLTKRVNHFRQELTKNLGEVKIKIKENMVDVLVSWLEKNNEIFELDEYIICKESDTKYWYAKRNERDKLKNTMFNYGIKLSYELKKKDERLSYLISRDDSKCVGLEEIKDLLFKINYLDLLETINSIILNQEMNFKEDEFFSKYDTLFNNTIYDFYQEEYFDDLRYYKDSIESAKRFKEILLSTYCELQNRTLEEAKNELKNSGYNDKFTCEEFFDNNSAYECYECDVGCCCGDVSWIFICLGLKIGCSDEDMVNAAKKIFSCQYCIVLLDE